MLHNNYVISVYVKYWSTSTLLGKHNVKKVLKNKYQSTSPHDCVCDFKICDPICEKVPFSHIKFGPFFRLKFHNFFILAYTSLKLSMVVGKVSGYSLVLWASWSAYVVKSYIILFDGMSNVWKRYLFANPVTYVMLYFISTQRWYTNYWWLIQKQMLYSFNSEKWVIHTYIVLVSAAQKNKDKTVHGRSYKVT